MPNLTLPHDDEELASALQAAATWLPHSDNPQYVRGAIAALGWLVGRVSTAPVSGDVEDVTLAAIQREENLADDAVYGAAGGEHVDRHFAVGAQTALLWARGREAQPPISLAA
ncbi:hypothetical protein [Catellatospora sp. NPDC049133]|uniref:hypothetical protein n=1 Tax=Catellatospora sp. NPDC049133 TaxID=3155499 RepID=UPI0034112E19